MKPHQLRIEAFGPYAERTDIDFDLLSTEGLFLIHGTTGAGKTFLLDALCLPSTARSPAIVPRAR